MEVMKRSETKYPLRGSDLAGTLQKAWEEGWLDEYSNEHFLIKALEGRLVDYPRLYSLPSSMSAMYPIREDTFKLLYEFLGEN